MKSFEDDSDDSIAKGDADRIGELVRMRAELFKLLDLAEESRRRFEDADRSVAVARMTTTAVVGVLATAAGLGVNILTASNSISFPLTTLFVAPAAIAIVLGLYLLQRRDRRLRWARKIERNTCDELVVLLHQSERSLAALSEMSQLERAEFRIRVARFDIPRDDDSFSKVVRGMQVE